MSTGYYDAHGIWHYGEDDLLAPGGEFSALLNKLADSLPDGIDSMLDAKILELEADPNDAVVKALIEDDTTPSDTRAALDAILAAAIAALPAPASRLITPTATGTGVTVDSSGLVILSGCTGLALNGLSGHRKVSIDIDITATGSGGGMDLWLRTASTDDTGANYDWRLLSAAATTPAPVVTSTAQTKWGGVVFPTTMFRAVLDLYGLSTATRTRGDINTASYFATDAPQSLVGKLSHRATTAYDGLKINPTVGTLTGTIRITAAD